MERTDATFWRACTRVLPKVEGKVRRCSYKPGWRRLSLRIALGAGARETGHPATQDLDATVGDTQDLSDHREQVLATLESGGIGAACVLTVGGATHMALTRERRELIREWVVPTGSSWPQGHAFLGLLAQAAGPAARISTMPGWINTLSPPNASASGYLDERRLVLSWGWGRRVDAGTASGTHSLYADG